MSHTFGPWEMDGDHIYAPDWRLVATVSVDPYNQDPAIEREDTANAALLAAAPELLEALQQLVAEQSYPPIAHRVEEWDAAMEKAYAAIAKATDLSKVLP